MRVSHSSAAEFDDPNLMSCAGLAPVLELAQRAGLHDLVAEHVSLNGAGGANPVLKIPALVAGMVAGADSIDDMALLRHGAMSRLFTGVRAPATLGNLHRVHLTPEGPARHRPPARASCPGREPRKPARPVHRPPLPRSVHRQPPRPRSAPNSSSSRRDGPAPPAG